MDPYKVLGVSINDDEETIKKAYRKLVKKYHPDRYVNTPMADMATEKIKEINEAYDMIMNKKSSGNYSYTGNYSNGGYNQSYTVSFQSVRMLISMRRFAEAESMLNSLAKNAEWNYLMGVIYINRGWYDQGREYIKTAVNMDPGNMEYQQTLNSFNTQNGGYRDFRMEYFDCCGYNPMLSCFCSSLICSRLCCFC